MAIFGGILIVIGIVLFFIRSSNLKRLNSINAARGCTAEDITTTATAVAAEIGPGSWQDYVKVQGQIECDQPLQSQLKKVECVYYKSKVIRKYEETVTRKNDDGETVRETERKSETISEDCQSVPFWLTDGTGRIEVNPDKAEIETVEVLSEFRPESQGSDSISFGGFSLSLGGTSSRGRTLGYEYKESILPLNRDALVIGMAADSTTQKLTIRKPTEGGQKFIISLKSAGELAQNASKTAQNLFYGMLGCLGVGAVLLIASSF